MVFCQYNRYHSNFIANFAQTKCELCSAGTYSKAASDEFQCLAPHCSKSCRICPERYACPKGAFEPIKCEAGYLSNYNRSQCIKCAGGTYSTATDTFACPAPSCTNECRTCPDGHVCPSGSSEATKCKAGYLANFAKTACVKCASGTYSLESDNFQCPAPFCQNQCRKCAPGKRPNPEQTQCL